MWNFSECSKYWSIEKVFLLLRLKLKTIEVIVNVRIIGVIYNCITVRRSPQNDILV